MQAEGTLPVALSELEIRRQIKDDLRRDLQSCEPGAEKRWRFKWDPDSASKHADFAILKFKFYAENKRLKINGVFTLSSPDSPGEWRGEFSAYPYSFTEIRIPLDSLPKSHSLELKFKGIDSPYLNFPNSNGVSLLYDNGGIFKNYISMFSILLLNMAVLAAIGLCSASLFSYSVSIFVTLVVYFVGISSDFFLSVLRELGYGWHGADTSPIYFLTGFIKLGIWLTKGIKCPPVVETFTENISIPVLSIFSDWGIATIIYATIVIIIGIYVLSVKEIDKLLN